MAIGKLSPATFEWIIDISRIEFLYYNCYPSPDFHLPDSSWYLRLSTSPNWQRISLHRRDYGAPKTVTYTIKVNLRTGVREFNETSTFHSRNTSCRENNIILRTDEVTSFSDLLISCCIKCDTPHLVAGKDNVTRAVQTEVSNSVIKKEHPKNEDWSSLDVKGVALLSDRMKELLVKGIGHDVTICVQDKKFPAHRNILSARSPVFAMMLSHDTKENNTGTINIEDCNPESFDEFLLYVYSGRMENLTPSNALQLYYPADKYDFPVLKERCVSLLKSSLCVESICDVVLLAVKHQEKELLQVATEFIAQNLKEILVSVGWLNFMSQNPVEANELYIKSMEILLPRK